MSRTLDELSIDILLLVFKHCDIYDLCKLKQTCTLFYRIINGSLHYILKNNSLVTNQVDLILKHRTLCLLTTYEKWRISHNWKMGCYKEKSFLYEHEKFIPWLHLTKDFVWLSRGKYIKAYKRHKDKVDVRRPYYVLSGLSNSDVCRFVFKNNYIISGQSDGSFWAWSFDNKSILFDISGHHLNDINTTDLENDLFVTGSKDNKAIVWPFRSDLNSTIEPHHEFELGDRVLSTSFSKGCDLLAVGTSGYGVAPLNIFNIERCKQVYELGSRFPKGWGVMDMKWENAHCLYSCGYDMHIRRWDTRIGEQVQSWDDPFQSTVYCMDTDNYCTIISGTSSYGRAVLWDTRMARYIQVYFVETCKKRGRSSPIYSLSFDSSQLFTATDLYLNLLDFSTKQGKIRNYNIRYASEVIVYS